MLTVMEIAPPVRRSRPPAEDLVVEVSEDARQWCLLRALEWNNWPLFLGQVATPLLLIAVPWWLAIFGLVTVNLIWSSLSEQFVDLELAVFGARLVQWRWAVALLSGWWIMEHGNLAIGIVAAAWPLLSMVLVLTVPPTRAPRLQQEFIERLDHAVK